MVWLWGQYQRAIRVPRGVLRAFGAVTHERASAVRVIRTRSTSALPAIQQLARTAAAMPTALKHLKAAVERSTVPSGKPCGS